MGADLRQKANRPATLMSPVARTDRHAGKALLVAGVGVGFARAMAFLFAVLANRGDVDVRLGDDLFDAGQVDSISGPIAETGIPLIFPDAAQDPVTYIANPSTRPTPPHSLLRHRKRPPPIAPK